jgi:adenylosuccinate synthase
MLADIVVGVQHGDEAKGKVTHHLCRTNNYTHVLRFNGGCNAGHTIYHDGKKFVTHHIPAGVFYGVKSIIGSGCVLNVEQFFRELQELEDGGIDTKGKIFVAENAHVITSDHIQEEDAERKIGTTKRGNGPAYRDKYSRGGVQAKEIPALEPYLINLYDEFFENKGAMILCEGAQGFGLDIDWGDYPYVTSSHCTTAGALLNGIPPQWVNQVWGVGKIYETYVGSKDFEPDEEIFTEIRNVGEEYGATTGRPRQCNWLNMDELVRALRINGVNHLVLNKMDVLKEVDEWHLISDGDEISFETQEQMKEFISDSLSDLPQLEGIHFSSSKERI